jgi:hypothetical protein
MSKSYSERESAKRDILQPTPVITNMLQSRPFAPPETTQQQQNIQPVYGRTEPRYYMDMEKLTCSSEPRPDPIQRKVQAHFAAIRAQRQQAASVVQAKLAIGAVGDKYEQEADQVASQVVQKINVPERVQREEAHDEEDEELQMKPLHDSIQSQKVEEELQMKPMVSQMAEIQLVQRWPNKSTKHLKERADERDITEAETEDAVKYGDEYYDPDYGGKVYYDPETGVTVCEAKDGTKTTCYKSNYPKSRWEDW